MRTSPILIAALATTVSLSCATRAQYSLKLPDLHTTLTNGLRVIVLPDDTTQLVAVAMRYEVGSNEDPAGKAGLAHLVEHLMFQKRADPKQPPIMAPFRQLTVYVNAYTNWDSTNYDSLAAKENLNAVLALEAARLYQGCENIDEATFEREREVVRNEIRQRLGRPEDQIEYLLDQDVYPDGHPYSHLPGGNDETIANLTLDDACQFMKDYYTPSRAILVVAGNTTEDEMKGLVGKWFADIPAREPKPRHEVTPIELHKKTFTHELDVEETTVNVAWKLPARYTPEDDATGIMIGRVAGITQSRGSQWEFATRVTVNVLGGAQAPVFVVSVHLRSDKDVGKALDAVWSAARQAHRGLEADSNSMEDSRAADIADKVYQFEDLTARTGEFADYAQFDKTGQGFAGELGRIKAVSLGRAKSYIKGHLKEDNAVVVIVKPNSSAQHGDKRAKTTFSAGDQDVHDELDVDPAEALQPIKAPKASALAGAIHFTLGNGMRVVMLPSGSVLPVMSVELVFDAGSAQESPSSAGMAQIAARFLHSGVAVGLGGDLDTADALGRVGAQRGAETDKDHTIFFVRGLTIYQDVLIKGLERLIKVGIYDQDSIESYRKSFGFAFKFKESKQRLAAQKALAEALYGKGHPYTVTGFPTPKSVSHIGRDGAMDFRGDHYTAKNATLIVAGKFDPKEVESAIRDNFGDWGGGRQDKPVAVAKVDRTAPIIIGVTGDDRPQIQAVISYPAPAGVDGQYAARRVLTEMLTLRMAAVREKLGSSYGVYARYDADLGGGDYLIAGGIDAPRGGESIAAMRAGIDSLRTGDHFEEDFVRARRTVLKSLLKSSTASTDLVSELEFLARYHLDEKFHDKLVKQVAALSPEQVKSLIAAELVPEREIVMCVGSRAALDKTFADAKLTATEWIDPEAETP